MSINKGTKTQIEFEEMNLELFALREAGKIACPGKEMPDFVRGRIERLKTDIQQQDKKRWDRKKEAYVYRSEGRFITFGKKMVTLLLQSKQNYNALTKEFATKKSNHTDIENSFFQNQCSEHAFELFTDGRSWMRVNIQDPRYVQMYSNSIQSVKRALHAVRFALDKWGVFADQKKALLQQESEKTQQPKLVQAVFPELPAPTRTPAPLAHDEHMTPFQKRMQRAADGYAKRRQALQEKQAESKQERFSEWTFELPISNPDGASPNLPKQVARRKLVQKNLPGFDDQQNQRS